MFITRVTLWPGACLTAIVLMLHSTARAEQVQPPSARGDSSLGRSVFSALPTEGRRLEPGDTVADALTEVSPIQGGGRRVKVWELAVGAARGIRIDMQSADFDPFLFVVGPGLGAGIRNDDGGDGLSASLCLAPEHAEGYRVVASAVGGGTGRYSLAVTPASTLGDCAFEDDFLVALDSLASLADGRQVLRVEDEVQGVLDDAAHIMNGLHGSAWLIDTSSDTPPERIRIEMRSAEMDAFLRVTGPGMPEGVADDDGGSGTNARLCFTPSASARYRVVASARGRNSGGRFDLSVHGDRDEGPCGGLRSRMSRGDNRIAAGEQKTGALDFRAPDRGIHVWELAAEPDRRLRVDLRSDDLDPVLYVLGPTPADSLFDDDGGDGLNSRLCFTPARPGNPRLVVTAWDGVRGAYALSVAAEEGPECGISARASHGRREPEEVSAEASGGSLGSSGSADVSVFSLLDDEDRRVAVGESMAGSLTDRDLLQGGGRRVQVWSLVARSGQRLRVDLSSSSFAPFLYFVGPELGVGVRGESGPASLADAKGRAWLCFTPTHGAGYRIVASSAGGGTGDFALSVADLTEDAEDECRPPVQYVATFHAEPDVSYHVSHDGAVARASAGEVESWGRMLPGNGSYEWLLEEFGTGLRFGVGIPTRSASEPVRYPIEGADGRTLGHLVEVGR